jgi:molybdenum cofactor cytidylyltransferase
MASSVGCGINKMNNLYPDTEAVILMVCDQPFVNAKLLKDLIKKQEESGNSIVASSYENIYGTPALFHKEHFNELSALNGDTGARSLIKRYAESIEAIPFDQGSIDIDTIEDYRNLVK